jgi:hypothetical protein
MPSGDGDGARAVGAAVGALDRARDVGAGDAARLGATLL